MRIGLITPYTGSNLGDAATLQAMTDNLRLHMPGVEVYGLTLNPEETERKHGIAGFSLTALIVELYSSYIPPSRGPQGTSLPNADSQDEMGSDVLRRILKELPLIGPMLKVGVNKARGVRNIMEECRHIVKSFQFARRLDAIIVCGGGQIDDRWGGLWGHPYVLLKWALLARLAKARFLVVSIGWCGIELPISQLFFKWALGLAQYRSYRDLQSKGYLGKFEFTHDDACVPDLALSLPSAHYRNNKIRQDKQVVTIGVGPIGFSPVYWTEADRSAYAKYFETLANFSVWLVQSGYHVKLFSTTGLDRKVLHEFQRFVQSRAPTALEAAIHVSEVSNVEQLLTEVSACKSVVASRLHGIILPHYVYTPVIAISLDHRMVVHMEDMKQGDYCVGIREVDEEDLRRRFLQQQGEYAQIKNAIESTVESMEGGLQRQYESIARMLML